MSQLDAITLGTLEDNDYRAESFTEVVSVQEAGDENVETGLLFNPSSGTMRPAATRIRVPPPSDSEGLRHRYRLMRVHWELVKSRYPDRRCFAGFESGIWGTIVDHLLGPKIWGFRAPGGVGLRWSDLLQYEFEIRRKAVERLTDGTHTITDALKSTYLDADIKGTHFTLQLVTGGKRDSAAASSSGEDGANKRLKTELAAMRKELNALRNATQQGGKGKRDSDVGKAHGWNDPPLRGGNPKGGKGAGGERRSSEVAQAPPDRGAEGQDGRPQRQADMPLLPTRQLCEGRRLSLPAHLSTLPQTGPHDP